MSTAFHDLVTEDALEKFMHHVNDTATDFWFDDEDIAFIRHHNNVTTYADPGLASRYRQAW